MRKNRFVKIFALLCAVLMLASCNSAADTDGTTLPPQQTTAPNEPLEIKYDFKLGYNAQDSLNPFDADSAANNAITRLIFDSLFICDNSFEPQPLLAQSYEHSGDIITVTLKQGVTFSDGSALTGYDVSYSLTLAKSSAVYSDRLANIAYVTLVDDYTLKFVTNSPNPYIVSCLDFPIIKSNSAASPIGSGRYRYVSLASQGNFLLRNSSYSLGENNGFGAIKLCDTGTVETFSYKIQNGDFDFAYDNLSSGKPLNTGTSSTAVPLSNMVFLGMNSESELLKVQAVRSAVQSAIDVNSITDSVYGYLAKPSALPFHPDWYAGDKTYNFETKPSLEHLAALGYNQITADGLATNGVYTLTLTLIVNEENEQRVKLANEVANAIIAGGINVNVVKYSFKEYRNAIKEKNYDLYIGEVKLTGDMNLSDIFGGFVYYQTTNEYGITRESAGREAYAKFLSGELSFNEYCDIFMKSCPFVPICFRNGAAVFTRSLGNANTMLAGDIFHGISNWTLP